MSWDLGLYLHFPFCIRKCRYCDFLSAPADTDTMQKYAAAMICEIRSYEELVGDRPVTSVFLGGGTPSVMPVRSLRQIFRALRESFSIEEDAEITMEMNPGTVNEAVLEFAEESVKRVSLGVQSADSSELAVLGRIHSFREAEESVRLLRKAGIRNLSMDLMSGIPGQTEESFRSTLRSVLDLDPEHISVYSLILEEGTPFYTEYVEKEQPTGPALPDEETDRRMYHETLQILKSAGYDRYEISNYAKPGFASRHNTRYWKRGDYLGFGIGAASLFEETRWTNQRDLRTYIETDRDFGGCVTELEKLDLRSAMEEFMFLGLRMTEGVSEAEFRDMFGRELRDIYGEILDRHVGEGLLQTEEDRYFLTERGLDVSNAVMADYLF